MSTVKLTKSAIIAAINEGCVKSRRSTAYNEEIGTLHERFNVKQGALARLFEANPDLEAAYKAKFGGVGGKYDAIELVEEEDNSDSTDQETSELQNADSQMPF
jgi:hypothetical protein